MPPELMLMVAAPAPPATRNRSAVTWPPWFVPWPARERVAPQATSTVPAPEKVPALTAPAPTVNLQTELGIEKFPDSVPPATTIFALLGTLIVPELLTWAPLRTSSSAV